MTRILEACLAVTQKIRAAARETEDGRRVPPELVKELARAGAFRMLVPAAYGGGEVTPAEMVAVIESVARADGSAGWCVMVGATAGLLSAYLDEATARELFGRDQEAVACGVFAPTGQATIEDGDFLRVKGRWSFASGCEHAQIRIGGVVVMEDGKPCVGPDGEVDVRHVMFDAADTKVIDTWDVSGLRGTGSHDFEVEDVRVPVSRAIRFLAQKPVAKGTLYAFPPVGLLSLGVAAVSLGIAREAITELVRVATDKKPAGGRRTLAERELVQVQVGEAEALVSSARAWVLSLAEEVTARAKQTGEVADADRAQLRLAATHATRACARAVDLVYELGGGTSIYRKNPLQRHFRDIHVATQHAMVQYGTMSLAGRVMLGQRVDRSAL